jgi:hypothetical protein
LKDISYFVPSSKREQNYGLSKLMDRDFVHFLEIGTKLKYVLQICSHL